MNNLNYRLLVHPFIKENIYFDYVELLLSTYKIPEDHQKLLLSSKIVVGDDINLHTFSKQYNQWFDNVNQAVYELKDVRDDFDLKIWKNNLKQELSRIPYLGNKPKSTYSEIEEIRKSAIDTEESGGLTLIPGLYDLCYIVGSNLKHQEEAKNYRFLTENKDKDEDEDKKYILLKNLILSDDITKIKVEKYPDNFIQYIDKFQKDLTENFRHKYFSDKENTNKFKDIEIKVNFDLLGAQINTNSNHIGITRKI